MLTAQAGASPSPLKRGALRGSCYLFNSIPCASPVGQALHWKRAEMNGVWLHHPPQPRSHLSYPRPQLHSPFGSDSEKLSPCWKISSLLVAIGGPTWGLSRIPRPLLSESLRTGEVCASPAGTPEPGEQGHTNTPPWTSQPPTSAWHTGGARKVLLKGRNKKGKKGRQECRITVLKEFSRV